MADKKAKTANSKDEKKAKQSDAKSSKAAAHVQAQKQEPKQAKQSMPRLQIIILAVVVVVIVAVIYLYPTSIISTVPFSTFKSNMQGSDRVSIAVTYSNQSQLSNESSCFTSIVQVVAHSRQASTIDFFLIDSQADTCTYSTSGLGGNVNPVTTNSTYCISKAYGEDGVFLNYSSSNYTRITSSHAFVYGNGAYMAQCPIAVELS